MGRKGLMLGAIAIVALGVYALRAPLAMQLMRAAAGRAITANALGALPDGLHLMLCGAGSPLPDPQRSGPCIGVVAGGQLFIVDAGSSAARNMIALGLRPGDLEAAFLTHFHSDHIDGLGELALQHWAGGNDDQRLPLYGPEGVARVASGLNEAYRLDVGYRVAHHGTATMPPTGAGFEARPFSTPAVGEPVVVWNENGVRVTAFRVDHAPIDPAVGYRFDYSGRSLVISGDTIQSAEIERMAKDVDLLVHEALAAHLVQVITEAAIEQGQTALAKITTDILDYHTTPVEAAETAQRAGARHLLFYHVVPALPVPGLAAAFLDGVDDAYEGGFTLGKDGVRVSLPAGSDAIEISGD
ncbi:MAG: MBL fold metallo-hydrolase [bacterium]|nr:MBL fold metallo-hydrolase [bacterium]